MRRETDRGEVAKGCVDDFEEGRLRVFGRI